MREESRHPVRIALPDEDHEESFDSKMTWWENIGGGDLSTVTVGAAGVYNMRGLVKARLEDGLVRVAMYLTTFADAPSAAEALLTIYEAEELGEMLCRIVKEYRASIEDPDALDVTMRDPEVPKGDIP